MAGDPAPFSQQFSAEIEERDGRYVIEIPDAILDDEASVETIHRVALVEAPADADTGRSATPASRLADAAEQSRTEEPPVDEGEIRTVMVETVGSEGDGIVKVEGGYVLIVPDADRGEDVVVRIDTVRDNVAFTSVVKRVGPTDPRNDTGV